MAQAPTPNQWLIDLQNGEFQAPGGLALAQGTMADRRGGYFHKTLSEVPFELYTQIMACDSVAQTQDRNAIHIPGIGAVHHFEGVALPEMQRYMLLCITDTELLLFPMGAGGDGGKNSAALNYHQKAQQQRIADRAADKAERQLEAARAACKAERYGGGNNLAPSGPKTSKKKKGGIFGSILAACAPPPKGSAEAADKAEVAAEKARAKAEELKRQRTKPVDRFALGHITFLGLQFEGKDNAWLWEAGHGVWADDNYHLSDKGSSSSNNHKGWVSLAGMRAGSQAGSSSKTPKMVLRERARSSQLTHTMR